MFNYKRALREAINAVSYSSGLLSLLLLWNRRGKIAVLYYHDPSVATLTRHLDFLSRKYTFVTLNDVAEGKRPAKSERSWIVITLDDGHAGNYHLVPVFRRYQVTPTIYLCTGIVGTYRRFWWQVVESSHARQGLKQMRDHERKRRLREDYGFTVEDESLQQRVALNYAEIKEMVDTVDFEAHTRFHPILPKCDNTTCFSEITACRQDIESLTGKPCRHFSFPNGAYGDREVEIASRCGYETARTADWGWINPGRCEFLLKGIRIPDEASIPTLVGQLCGFGQLLNVIAALQRNVVSAFSGATLKRKLRRNAGKSARH